MLRATFVILLFSLTHTYCQEIAITFDDAPTPDGAIFTGAERSDRIISHLKKHNVKEAAFFILTSNIDELSEQRLTRYANAGHILANHSHSHAWIHEIGTDNFIRDVEIADSLLGMYEGYLKWFRYPFLNEGRSVGSRDSIRAGLNKLALSNGYVTVDNYDWYINSMLQRAKKDQKKIHKDKLRKLYIDHIFNSVQFYDGVARKHLGRSPRHVLLLHENDLSALFLGDLLAHLTKNGWRIISPREAYLDPIAAHIPDVLFNGQGRVAAIAREKGVAARDLVPVAEDEIYLDSLATSMRVFE